MESTLLASLSGTFLQTLPELVTSLKGHFLSPRSCLMMLSAPSRKFGCRNQLWQWLEEGCCKPVLGVWMESCLCVYIWEKASSKRWPWHRCWSPACCSEGPILPTSGWPWGFLIFLVVWGSHTKATYSRSGWTNTWYAPSFTEVAPVFRLCLSRPKIRCGFMQGVFWQQWSVLPYKV